MVTLEVGASARAALDVRGMAASIVLGIVGALTILVLPGFVMLIGAQAGLDDQHMGIVAAWDIDSMAAAIGVSTFVISRVNWRHLALAGIALLAIGDLMTALSHGFPSIVAARICAGTGEGLAIACSFAALGSASNPDRAFGIYLVAGMTFGAAFLALQPIAEARFGASSIFVALSAMTFVSAALLTWLPPNNPHAATWAGAAPPVSKVLAFSGLSSVFLYFIAQGAMWGYFGRIGVASGISPANIGTAMGLSSISGVGGALLAISVQKRLGRTIPLAASGAISLLSFWLLAGHVTPAALVTSGLLLNFGWNLAQPLLSGVCCDADPQGRVVVAMGCIQTVGSGLGPALAAMTLRGTDFSPAIWLSVGVLVLSLVIVISGLKARAADLASLELPDLRDARP